MAQANPFPLVAVSVGNSRVKLGEFELPLERPLPHPKRSTAVNLDWSDADLSGWLPGDPADYAWSIASVNRPAATRLVEWLRARKVARVQLLSHADLPLEVDLSRPDLVGVDRLANAVAVNRLRPPDEPVVIIDLGSAITVDLVSKQGAFAGGAILPGIAMSARALHEFTDLLPLVEVISEPQLLDKSTTGAIRFGLYWGAVGALRELVARLAGGPAAAQVFLTGGGAPTVSAILAKASPRPPQFVPHLTLSGIALAASTGAPAKDAR
jgi:type III pantothenate kinase